MKTPYEIKKGLECCEYGCQRCFECPYSPRESDSTFDCIEAMKRDALELIQRLDKDCVDAENHATALYNQVEQLERERDAAVADIPRACGYCKWFEINRGGNMTECHNPNGCRNISGINTGFEWRGVKED